MTLQDSSIHKATADSKTSLSYNYNMSIFDAIETECLAHSSATPPTYSCFHEYSIDKNNLVKQPDQTTIDCDKFIAMLKNLNYTVAHQVKYGKLKIHVSF